MLVVMGWVYHALAPSIGAGEWLANVPPLVRQGQIWRLLSYPFAVGLTGSNLITTIFFVPFACSVEQALGTVRFRRLFWASIGLAALPGLVLPGGAPGGGLAIPSLAMGTAFCLLHWTQTVYLMLILPVKVKYVIPITLLGILTAPSALWPALVTPLAVAYLMVKRNWFMQQALLSKPAAKPRRRRSRLGEDFRGPKVTPIRPLTQVPPTETEAQVDLILDKLRQEGMSSLTSSEREVLDSHSKRLRHGDERM
jgi:hypothetical protein